jgi:hypothetical protein
MMNDERANAVRIKGKTIRMNVNIFEINVNAPLPNSWRVSNPPRVEYPKRLSVSLKVAQVRFFS